MTGYLNRTLTCESSVAYFPFFKEKKTRILYPSALAVTICRAFLYVRIGKIDRICWVKGGRNSFV